MTPPLPLLRAGSRVVPTFLVLLVALGCADLGDAPADSELPSLSVNDVTVTEGEPVSFEVVLSEVSDNIVVYSFATGDETASQPADYLLNLGTDTLVAGVTSRTIAVLTNDDAAAEASEKFRVVIRPVLNATITDSLGTATITDNDAVGLVSFSAQVRPLFDNFGCLAQGCHGGGSSEGGLALGDGSYATVRTATGSHGAIIVAGNASASSLYYKTTATPQFGDRMPQFGPLYLSVEQQNLIRDWIDQGAQDN
ncbi:MAG TPA: Calx-beta domain-containing protein [Candidatus Deferrimicrobium sp.]|nr:Calx-beta domain-containing protein [Candidatus Deferrimicrobium sp.]